MDQFATNPAVNAKTLRELLSADPDKFFQNAIPVLKRLEKEPGSTYVLVLLMAHGLIVSHLMRDDAFAPEELSAIARQLSHIDPMFGIKLLQSVLPDPFETASTDPDAVNLRLRLMDVVQSVSDGSRLLPLMMRLLRDPDARVRSKAALLVGRTKLSTRWVEECLTAEDSRVRANAVESIWGVDSEEVRELLWDLLSAPDNRSVGNSLIGLYRMGDAGAIEQILLMAQDSRDLFRSTAAWVMGRTGDPRFQPALVNLIRDSAPVRTTAFRALGSLKQARVRLANAPPLRLRGWRNLSSQGQDEMQVTVALDPQARESNAADSQSNDSQADDTEQKDSQPNDSQTTPGRKPDNGPLSGLRPTEFILYRDAQVVPGYEVREVVRQEPLALAFMLPFSGTDVLSHTAHIEALQAALAFRRPNDRWLIARYDGVPVRPPAPALTSQVWSGNGPLHLRIDDSQEPSLAPSLAPAPDLAFLTDLSQLDESIEAPPSRARLADPLLCLQSVIRAAYNIKAPHIVLIRPSNANPLSAEFLSEAAAAVSNLKATFHAVFENAVSENGVSENASRPAPDGASYPAGIRELCRESGGFCIGAAPEEFPRMLAGLALGLIDSYLIRVPEAKGSLKVEVFGRRGCGSLVLA